MIHFADRIIVSAIVALGLCLPVCAGAQQTGAAKSNIARTGPVPGVGPTGSMYDGNNAKLPYHSTVADLVAGSSSGASSMSPADRTAQAGAGANSATATGGAGLSGGGNQTSGKY